MPCPLTSTLTRLRCFPFGKGTQLRSGVGLGCSPGSRGKQGPSSRHTSAVLYVVSM